jgi:hypothetical protein
VLIQKCYSCRKKERYEYMRLEIVFRGIQCHTTTDDFLEGSEDEVIMNITAVHSGNENFAGVTVNIDSHDIGTMAEGQTKRFDIRVYFEDISRFEHIFFFVHDIDTIPDSLSDSGDDLIGSFSVSAITGSIVWTPRSNAENRTPSAIGGFEGNVEFFLNGREGEYSIFFTAAIV